MGGDKCNEGISHCIGEGRSASAGSAASLVTRAAVRGVPPIEQIRLRLEANPGNRGFVFGHIRGKSAGNQENSPQLFHHGGAEGIEKNSPQTRQTDGGQAHTDSHRQARIGPLSKHCGAVFPVPLHWEAWDQKAKEES